MSCSYLAHTSATASACDPAHREVNQPSETQAAGEELKKNRILIVEDDFLIAMQAEAALLDAGFDIVGIASTAPQALSLARDRRPAIAVMDIRLAGPRDGIDAAGDLFQELGIRCAFATAHDDQQTKIRAEAYAPLGWLAKPYTMASLISLVRDAIVNAT